MGYHQRNLGISHERMDKDRVPIKSGGFWIILDHEIVVTVIQMIQCHWDKIGICLGYTVSRYTCNIMGMTHGSVDLTTGFHMPGFHLCLFKMYPLVN